VSSPKVPRPRFLHNVKEFKSFEDFILFSDQVLFFDIVQLLSNVQSYVNVYVNEFKIKSL